MKVRSTIFDLDISGKLGNVVGGKARGGIQWLRSRVIPINPQTSLQSAVRAAMSSLAGHWRNTLTQAQRNAWDTYAASVTKGGLTLTGETWYVGANTLRAQVNTQQPGTLTTQRIDDGPTTLSRAPLSPLTVSVDAAGDLEITYPAGEEWAAAVDGGIGVWVSPIISPSRKFNNQGYTFAGFIEGAAVPPASPQSIAGAFPVNTVGDRYFLYVRAMLPDGRYSEPQFLSGLTVA